jgi:hypothetical protein
MRVGCRPLSTGLRASARRSNSVFDRGEVVGGGRHRLLCYLQDELVLLHGPGLRVIKLFATARTATATIAASSPRCQLDVDGGHRRGSSRANRPRTSRPTTARFRSAGKVPVMKAFSHVPGSRLRFATGLARQRGRSHKGLELDALFSAPTPLCKDDGTRLRTPPYSAARFISG